MMISWKNELNISRNQGAWLKSMKYKMNSYVKMAKDLRMTKPPRVSQSQSCKYESVYIQKKLLRSYDRTIVVLGFEQSWWLMMTVSIVRQLAVGA